MMKNSEFKKVCTSTERKGKKMKKFGRKASEQTLSAAASAARHRRALIGRLVGSQEIALQLRGVGCEARRVDDLVHKLFKAALHVDARLRAGFEEQAPVLPRERNPFLLRHDPLALLQIDFVAD